jgi:outer membrane protein TolC
MRRHLVLSLFIFLSLGAGGQRLLTLEEAIATALRNNYDILLAKNDSMAAAIDYAYRNAGFFPRLNASAGTTWNNTDVNQVLADGTKRESEGIRSNNVNAQLALNWTLFDGLKMFATRDKLEEFVKLGELGIRNQVVNTVATVINTYYNIVRQKQQLLAIREQMSISMERVKLAEYKLDIGVGTKPDVLQSKVDLNAQKALELDQEKMIAQLKQELNRLMDPNGGIRDTPGSTTYDVTDTIPINHDLVLGDIQAGIETSNPTLLIAKKNVDIAGLTLKERKAERFPVVAFNSAYNYNRLENHKVINNFSTLYNRNRGFNFGFIATIPIFNNFNNRRLIRQAENDIGYQQLFYEYQRSLLNLALFNAWMDYEQQRKALLLEEENILLARENVDIIFQVYRLNSTTLIQLKEAQRSLQDAYTRLITARYNTKLAETELLRLKGELVK